MFENSPSRIVGVLFEISWSFDFRCSIYFLPLLPLKLNNASLPDSISNKKFVPSFERLEISPENDADPGTEKFLISSVIRPVILDPSVFLNCLFTITLGYIGVYVRLPSLNSEG